MIAGVGARVDAPGTVARVLEHVGQAARAGFDVLVPAACVACRRACRPGDPPLCGVCRSRLPRLPRPRCERCAEPLGNLATTGLAFGRCGTCEGWPPALVRADAPFAFEGVARRVVRAHKYSGWRAVAPLMASYMQPVLREMVVRLGWNEEKLQLVPVPLTPSRQRERGFNQARDLAAGLSDLGSGTVADLLHREPGGGRQARANALRRRANVQGRFRVRGGRADPNAPVVIVDDVLTTGSTAFACAEALCEAGFSRVATVSFARTLRSLETETTARASSRRENR